MGKKKGQKTKRLLPFLEKTIVSGDVVCKEHPGNTAIDLFLKQHDVNGLYEICFGYNDPSDDVGVIVFLKTDGNIDYYMCNNIQLTRHAETWFLAQLKEIIVMHRLGGFSDDPINSVFSLYPDDIFRLLIDQADIVKSR